MIPSVVIHYLDISRTYFGPYKADSPLIVNANAMLTLSVTLQSFQMVSGRGLHEIQRLSSIQLRQFPLSHRQESSEPARTLALVQCQRVFALERLDHAGIVLRAA